MEETKLINEIIKFLNGKKTHVCVIALGVIAVLFSHGYIDELTRDLLGSVFGVGGAMAFRSGMKKLEPKSDEVSL